MNSYVPLSEDTVRLIFDIGTVESYARNAIVFHQNRFNAFEYFQLEGVSHRFNINEEKESVTTGIYLNQAVITPHFARTINGQSIFSVQALTDCVFVQVPAGTFREYIESHPEIRIWARTIVEREFMKNLKFEAHFRSYSARERLLSFREHYPSMENVIPHSVIASFLGITPVSFSRLRNEQTKG